MITQPRIKNVVKGRNRYCGPAAISIITRIDTTRAARLLRLVSGKKMICGIFPQHMKAALEKLGYRMTPVRFDGKTLAQWINSATRDQEAMHLVVAGRHYSVVQGNEYCCGLSRSVLPVSKALYRKSRMKSVYRIERVLEVDPDAVIPAPTPKPKNESWLKRIQVTRRAKQFGIDCSQEDETIWVYPPATMFSEENEEQDPYFNEHSHADWNEAEKAVEVYISLISKSVPVLPQAASPQP